MSEPNPHLLSGLIDYARLTIQGQRPVSELKGYFEAMRERISAAYEDRQSSFEERREILSDSLIGLIERNLAACQAVEESLTGFLAAWPDDKEGCETALTSLATASEQFRTSSEHMQTLATSVPVCTRCGSTGPENLCPECDLDRLIPDPSLEDEEELEFPVPEEFLAVASAYGDVLDGDGNLADLANVMQPLEFSLLEAQALAEQSIEEHPDDESQQELLDAINSTLEGLERMAGVRENRQTKELNAGWKQVFKGSVLVGQALARMSGEKPDVQLGDLAEIPEVVEAIEREAEE